MKTTTLCTIALLLLAGCRNYPRYTHFPVDIISDPPGAKIEINGNYIGATPCSTTIQGWTASRVICFDTHVKANPTQPGHYTQHKTYYRPQRFRRHGMTIPHTIYFNMTLQPGDPEAPLININNNIQNGTNNTQTP